MTKSRSIRKNMWAWYKGAVLLFLLLAAGLVFCACDADYADENVSPYLEFTLLEDGTYSVKASDQLFKESNVSVEIPAKYKRTAVTMIESFGFKDATGLIDITIPDSVIRIGKSAFYNSGIYNNPTNWTSGVLYIGKHLIRATTDVSGTYSIKPGTICVAGGAFSDSLELTNIVIPDTVKGLGKGVFHGAGEIQKIHIPSSVSYIEEGFFSGHNLPSITVDAGNKYHHVSGNCLIGTKSKILIIGGDNSVIPDDGSVVRIGAWAFCYRTIKSLTIPNTVTSIGEGAFKYCKSLISVSLPDSITEIGADAFHACKLLEKITLPTNLKSIERATFYDCVSLKSVTIPGSVTSLGSYSFSGCTSLKYIYYKGTKQQWNAIKKGEYWDNQIGKGKYTVCCSDGNISIRK